MCVGCYATVIYKGENAMVGLVPTDAETVAYARGLARGLEMMGCSLDYSQACGAAFIEQMGVAIPAEWNAENSHVMDKPLGRA